MFVSLLFYIRLCLYMDKSFGFRCLLLSCLQGCRLLPMPYVSRWKGFEGCCRQYTGISSMCRMPPTPSPWWSWLWISLSSRTPGEWSYSSKGLGRRSWQMRQWHPCSHWYIASRASWILSCTLPFLWGRLTNLYRIYRCWKRNFLYPLWFACLLYRWWCPMTIPCPSRVSFPHTRSEAVGSYWCCYCSFGRFLLQGCSIN